VMYVLLGVCAYTYLHHASYATGADAVNRTLAAIPDAQIRQQMTIPVALGHLLPAGVKGVLCALFFFGLVACDGSYLHSWGSILIQDVVLPLRQRPFTPDQHLRLLRWAIAGVALFGFLFSALFHQTEYILMFFAITGAIYVGGAGAVLLGGIYWKKGTTPAAWTAMLTGSLLAVGGLLVQQPGVWGRTPALLAHLVQWVPALGNVGWVHTLQTNFPAKFPINGQVMYFIAMLTSLVLYCIISLLTCREDFNMDRLLHRGAYAIQDDVVAEQTTLDRFSLQRFIGIDRQFTTGDKVLSWSVFLWSLAWFVVFVLITLWNLVQRWPTRWWATYWRYELIIIPLAISVVTTVWFAWGGIRDMVRLFRALQTVRRSEKDDGRVVDHHNVADDPVAGAG
jgi:solute:Na+ symporter, SSS family